jgi:hypothetical protein
MGVKEIATFMYRSFFIIFTGSVLSMYVFNLIFGDGVIMLHNITALLVMTILAELAFFIFYSKKELSRRRMSVRYIVHMFVILGIMLSTATFMEWILWSEPLHIIVFVALVVAVYVSVFSFNHFWHKKLADKLNEKLKERYTR